MATTCSAFSPRTASPRSSGHRRRHPHCPGPAAPSRRQAARRRGRALDEPGDAKRGARGPIRARYGPRSREVHEPQRCRQRRGRRFHASLAHRGRAAPLARPTPMPSAATLPRVKLGGPVRPREAIPGATVQTQEPREDRDPVPALQHLVPVGDDVCTVRGWDMLDQCHASEPTPAERQGHRRVLTSQRVIADKPAPCNGRRPFVIWDVALRPTGSLIPPATLIRPLRTRSRLHETVADRVIARAD
jgi:hypothetical protein